MYNKTFKIFLVSNKLLILIMILILSILLIFTVLCICNFICIEPEIRYSSLKPSISKSKNGKEEVCYSPPDHIIDIYDFNSNSVQSIVNTKKNNPPTKITKTINKKNANPKIHSNLIQSSCDTTPSIQNDSNMSSWVIYEE